MFSATLEGPGSPIGDVPLYYLTSLPQENRRSRCFERMSEQPRRTVDELAASVGGRVFGDGTVVIERVNSLEAANAGEIAYVEDEKLFAAANSSRASCLIVPAAAA